MLRIHPEFESLIPQLTPEEHAQLEDNLLFEGCRDPLIVWKETDYLLDGHNRHEICEKFHIPYKIRRISFPDEATAKRWILTNQFGRRNLTPYQRAELALQLKPILEEESQQRLEAGRSKGGRAKKGGEAKSVSNKYVHTCTHGSPMTEPKTAWWKRTSLPEGGPPAGGKLSDFRGLMRTSEGKPYPTIGENTLKRYQKSQKISQKPVVVNPCILRG